MYPETKDRTSVILIGDSVDDSSMCDGIINMDQCISIGFLNDKIDEKKWNDFAVTIITNRSTHKLFFIFT